MTTDRNNSGTLARNNRKTLDRHPDIRGQCVIDGRAYWIAGWKRENAGGVFYSLAFTPKDALKEQPATTQATRATATEHIHDGKIAYTAEPAASPPTPKPLREVLDDDIPF